jgi:hypothetical protein
LECVTHLCFAVGGGAFLSLVVHPMSVFGSAVMLSPLRIWGSVLKVQCTLPKSSWAIPSFLCRWTWRLTGVQGFWWLLCLCPCLRGGVVWHLVVFGALIQFVALTLEDQIVSIPAGVSICSIWYALGLHFVGACGCFMVLRTCSASVRVVCAFHCQVVSPVALQASYWFFFAFFCVYLLLAYE